MRKIIVLLMICYACAASAQQQIYLSSGKPLNGHKKQQKKKGFDLDNLVWGGGLGASLGNVTALSITPVLGYKISEHLALGAGFGFQYVKAKDFYELTDVNNNTSYYDYKSSMISASVWGNYVVWENIFAHVEYEHNFMSFKDYGFDPSGSGSIVGTNIKYNAPSLLIGPGYRQPISDRASIIIQVLYDVLQDKYSPYRNRPEIRFGFLVGF